MFKSKTTSFLLPAATCAVLAAGCLAPRHDSSALAQEGASGQSTLAAAPRIYFQENFQNYRDTAPTLIDAPGISLGNDPIWTQTAEANISLSKPGLILKQYSPGAMAGVKNYDVLFKFRLRESNGVLGKFDVRLRQEQNGKQGDVVIGITSDAITFSGEGAVSGVTGNVKLPFTIAKNEWHSAAITVKNGSLVLYIDQDRVLRQVAETKIPNGTPLGVNFSAYAESPFSVSEIVVREAAALPSNSITNLLPTARKINAAEFKTGGTHTVPANDIFGANIRTGLEKDAVKMNVNWADGTASTLTFNVTGVRGGDRKIIRNGEEVKELPDGIIRVSGLGDARAQLDIHVRPRLRRYHTSYSVTNTFTDIVRDWDLLPKASEHPLKVELRRTPTGADVYFDGALAGSLAGAGVKDVSFALAPTASFGQTFSFAVTQPAKYLALDVAAQGMAKTFSDAKASVKPGFSEVKGVPMLVASGDGSADIGLTREGQGNWALEVDEYMARQPFDGLLTEVHFTVPGGVPYGKAWVLAAVDPDTSKDPILTTRITRYMENGIGGNRVADTTLTLPRNGENPGEGITPVGTVSKTDTGGKKIEVPLYLVEVPLQTGEILDLVKEPVLNFEFFGKPWENFEQINNSIKPDPKSTSAVQVFGVTLEKSPIGLDFVQAQPSNIFHNDETPETTAVLTSFAPAKGKLAWEIRDVDGKKVGGNAADFNFANSGQERKVNIPLKMPQVGWYELSVSIQNDAGQTILTHPASFALLGRDERKAKYDSPYSTWWFDGAHLTPKELDIAGPVMFKAGIRKAGWTGQTEAAMAKYFITKPQFNMPFKFDDLKKPEAAFANAEKQINEALAKWPHLREINVYHESGPGNDIPLELIGLKPTNMTADRIAYEKRYADLLNMIGPFFRQKFPQLKLVVGNNSASQANIAAILRHGGNPDFIDYIGIEAPSQVFIPEKLQEWSIQGHHIAQDTAKVLSGRNIPATGCYEFTYRSERDMGQQQQAEWYTRDVLISLANGFTTISPGILFDTSNSYYNGLWGGSGILERSPYGYPKKSYVAYATLTNVLDQVKLRRQVPTGSTTVYAVEFDRADNKKASALWAARGDADFNIEFAGDTPVRIVEMYGRSRDAKTTGGKLTVRVGTSPVYVVADREIKAITLSIRAFPKDDARAAVATVAAPLDSADAVKIDNNKSLDTPKVTPVQTPIREHGDFVLRQATDEQKGAAIELELKTDKTPNLSKYITEYSTVRLSTPAPVSGNPAALGVWVKGNSNWGRVMFEIEDAKGEVWKSLGTGGWGCDILDCPCNLAVNFDGWNFVALPLRDTKLFNDHSPGPVLEQWVSDGGDKKIDYPVKIRALTVEMNRTPLDLIDFKKAAPTIRLKNVSGIYEK
jgi:hypothetical protein